MVPGRTVGLPLFDCNVTASQSQTSSAVSDAQLRLKRVSAWFHCAIN